MKMKKCLSFTKPSTRKIKTKTGQTRTIHVKAHTNNLARPPKRK